MKTRRPRLAFSHLPLAAFALLLLAACTRVPEETVQPVAPTPVNRPASLIGPTFTLVDTLGRPLECVIVAKEGPRVLVTRATDQSRFLIEFDRLSPESQSLLANYSDTNELVLRTFLDDRDYAEAKRSVRVELVSATWSNDCTSARNFFAAEGITYAAFDPESMPGKQRRADWKSEALPSVKIGGRIVEGYDKAAYVEAMIAAYREGKLTAAQP